MTMCAHALPVPLVATGQLLQCFPLSLTISSTKTGFLWSCISSIGRASCTAVSQHSSASVSPLRGLQTNAVTLTWTLRTCTASKLLTTPPSWPNMSILKTRKRIDMCCAPFLLLGAIHMRWSRIKSRKLLSIRYIFRSLTNPITFYHFKIY